MRRLAILALLALACTRGPVAPEKVFVEFVASIAAGDEARAWKLLTEDTRLAAQALGAQSDPAVDGPTLLFGGGLELAQQLDTVAIVEAGAKRTRLEVTAVDGSSMDVELRLEGGRWRVHLPL